MKLQDWKVFSVFFHTLQLRIVQKKNPQAHLESQFYNSLEMKETSRSSFYLLVLEVRLYQSQAPSSVFPNSSWSCMLLPGLLQGRADGSPGRPAHLSTDLSQLTELGIRLSAASQETHRSLCCWPLDLAAVEVLILVAVSAVGGQVLLMLYYFLVMKFIMLIVSADSRTLCRLYFDNLTFDRNKLKTHFQDKRPIVEPFDVLVSDWC